MEDIYSIQEKMIVQFVKKQDKFIRAECIKHIKENKQVKMIYIDEDKLNYIFDLGLEEYKKRLAEQN